MRRLLVVSLGVLALALPAVAGALTARALAARTVNAHGYVPVRLRDYNPRNVLRVLLGTPDGSSAEQGRKAFFFIGNRYWGTDVTEPSRYLRIVRQTRTWITLRYGVYSLGDPTCCPSGHRNVRFRWNGRRLLQQGRIPSIDVR